MDKSCMQFFTGPAIEQPKFSVRGLHSISNRTGSFHPRQICSANLSGGVVTPSRTLKFGRPFNVTRKKFILPSP